NPAPPDFLFPKAAPAAIGSVPLRRRQDRAARPTTPHLPFESSDRKPAPVPTIAGTSRCSCRARRGFAVGRSLSLGRQCFPPRFHWGSPTALVSSSAQPDPFGHGPRANELCSEECPHLASAPKETQLAEM